MSAERPRQDGQAGGHPAIVVIGDGDLSDETVRALEASKARVTRLRQPDKGDVRSALEGVAIDYVAVVARADAIVPDGAHGPSGVEGRPAAADHLRSGNR